MKKPKEIYVCRHTEDSIDEPIKKDCYWYEYNMETNECYIDRKPCNQVTYVRKDEKKWKSFYQTYYILLSLF